MGTKFQCFELCDKTDKCACASFRSNKDIYEDQICYIYDDDDDEYLYRSPGTDSMLKSCYTKGDGYFSVIIGITVAIVILLMIMVISIIVISKKKAANRQRIQSS